MLLRTIAVVSLLSGVLSYCLWGFSLLAAAALFAGCYLGLLLLAFAFLCIVCAFVDMDKPQEEDSPFYRFFLYLYIDALMVLAGLKMETAGLEKAPKDGRFLLVCNHQPSPSLALFVVMLSKAHLTLHSWMSGSR